MEALKIEHQKKDSVDIVELEGILNADTSGNLEELLTTLAEVEKPLILFDLPELTYISSAGIGCFIGAIKNIRKKGGDIRFSNMSKKVKRVFILLDMDDFFQFFASLDEGVAGLYRFGPVSEDVLPGRYHKDKKNHVPMSDIP